MTHESLVGGGYLVELETGTMAIEGRVARVGDVVESSREFADGGQYRSAIYTVGRRVIAGTDLRYARRVARPQQAIADARAADRAVFDAEDALGAARAAWQDDRDEPNYQSALAALEKARKRAAAAWSEAERASAAACKAYVAARS